MDNLKYSTLKDFPLTSVSDFKVEDHKVYCYIRHQGKRFKITYHGEEDFLTSYWKKIHELNGNYKTDKSI